MEDQSNQSVDSYDYNGTDYPAWPDLTMQQKAASIFTPQWIVLYVLFFVGLTMNILSIVAIAHMPCKLNSHFKLIISLALSDGLIIVSTVIHDCIFIFASWNMCLKLAKEFLLNTAVLLTLMNLIGMATDLYISILHPLKYNNLMSNTRCTFMIFMLWFISVALSLTDILAAAVVDRPAETSLCMMVGNDHYDVSLMIICLIFFVLICITVVYVRILMIVRRMITRDPSLKNKHNSKVCVTTFLVTITFAICWLPFGIFTSIIYLLMHTDNTKFIQENQERLFHINEFLVLVLLLNTVFDPLIYAVRLRSVQLGFKEIFKKLICRKKCRDLRLGQARTSFISNYKRNTTTFDPDMDNRIHTDLDIARCPTDLFIKYSPVPCYSNTQNEQRSKETFYQTKHSKENDNTFNSAGNAEGNIHLNDNSKCLTTDVDDKVNNQDPDTHSNVTETIRLGPLTEFPSWK